MFLRIKGYMKVSGGYGVP